MRKINIRMGLGDTVTAPVDDTLSIAGMAADAKATGDAIKEKASNEDLEAINDRVTDLEMGSATKQELEALDTRVTDLEMGSATKQELEALDTRVDDLEYDPIEISAFMVTPNKAEAGSSVSAVALEYAMNKLPEAASLDGIPHAVTEKAGVIEQTGLAVTTNRTWTLAVQDERSANASRSATLEFLFKAYFGAAKIPESVNSAFLLGLAGGALTNSRERTFTVDAGADEYIWYAVPAFLGACVFSSGGVEGGFAKVSAFSHTNASGGVIDYDVYRSDNANLGGATITVL